MINNIKLKLEQLGYFVSVKRDNKWLQVETKDIWFRKYIDNSPYKSIPIKDFNPFYIEQIESKTIKLTYFFPKSNLDLNFK